MIKGTITSVSELSEDTQGIVYIRFPEEGVKVNVHDSREIFEGRMQLPSAGTKQLLLVDLRTNPKPDREARNFAKSTEMVNNTLAMALIVDGLVSKLLGNFFIGFNKGDFPVKLFTLEERAIAWLLKYK